MNLTYYFHRAECKYKLIQTEEEISDVSEYVNQMLGPLYIQRYLLPGEKLRDHCDEVFDVANELAECFLKM